MAKSDDIKTECFTLWTQSFEGIWNKCHYFFPLSPNGDTARSNPKNFIPRLTLYAAFSSFSDELEQHEAQLEAAEKKIERLEEVVASLADSRILHDVTTRINSPDSGCEKIMTDPVIKRSLTPTRTDGCNNLTNGKDRSPSLLHHEPHRKCLQRGSPKSKENESSMIPRGNAEKEPRERPPFEKLSAKPRSDSISAKDLKRTSISNNKNPLVTPKSASQTKRLVQKRLELVHIPPKIPRVDLSASEEYLGGERLPAIKRKNEVATDLDDSDEKTVLCPTAASENKKKARGMLGNRKNDEFQFDLDETCLPLEDATTTAVPEDRRLTDEFEDSPSLFPDFPPEQQKLQKPDLGLSRFKVPKTAPSCLEKQVKHEVNSGNGMAHLNQDVGHDTMKVIADFNKRTRQDKDEPTFKYKPDVAVRKKAERDKLPAISCDLCEEYFRTIASQLTDSARAEIVNRCSKHRQQYKPREHNTPPGFWATDIPSTPECIQQGLMRVEKNSNPRSCYRI